MFPMVQGMDLLSDGEFLEIGIFKLVNSKLVIISPVCERGESRAVGGRGAHPAADIFGGYFRRPIRGQGLSAANPRPGIFGGPSEARDFRRRLEVRARRIAIGAQYIFPWFGLARSIGLALSKLGGISDITTKCLYPILSVFCTPHFGTPPWLIWLQGKEFEWWLVVRAF